MGSFRLRLQDFSSGLPPHCVRLTPTERLNLHFVEIDIHSLFPENKKPADFGQRARILFYFAFASSRPPLTRSPRDDDDDGDGSTWSCEKTE
jgi:hypothetical protein